MNYDAAFYLLFFLYGISSHHLKQRFDKLYQSLMEIQLLNISIVIQTRLAFMLIPYCLFKSFFSIVYFYAGFASFLYFIIEW